MQHSRRAALAGVAASAVLALAVPALAQSAPELRIGARTDVTSVDPHYHNLGPNKSVAAHFFDPLILQDAQQRMRPGLAVSWRALDDTTWEFKLRPGVTWHDGSPFTAEDVAFTIRRAPSVPNSPSSFGLYIRQITNVEVVDQHTIRFKTNTVFPLMPVYMSTFGIVSRRHGENATTNDYNSGKAMVGTGPYRFISWTTGDATVMERNPNYWGGAEPWGRVTMKFIRNDAARLAALIAGDVDFIDNVPTTDIARIERDERFRVSRAVANRVMYMYTDHLERSSPFVRDTNGEPMAKNPFLDVRVRRAISMAINRPALRDRIMDGAAEPTGQIMPEGWFGWSRSLPVPAYDPDGGKRLMAEAGYPNGFRTSFHCTNNRYVNDGRLCQAIAQMLSRIGIQAEVQAQPFAAFIGPATRQEFSLFMLGWGIDTAEPSSPLSSLLATFDRAKGRGASNRARYSNAEVDRLLDEALKTLDDEKRQQLFIQATEIAIRDVGLIPLHHNVNVFATRRPLTYQARADEWTLAMGVRRGN